jgi:hypothetical protein
VTPPIDPPCEVILYRSIWYPTWIDPDDNSRMMAEAFAKRRPKLKDDGTVDPMDADGLSVFDQSRISIQYCVESSNRCYGLGTLHVGTLRAAGFTVIRDPEFDQKCLITNAPLENPADAEQEHMLDQLAEMARIHHRCIYKKLKPKK